MIRRAPMPEDLLKRREELEQIRAAMSPEEREHVRQCALKSNRYLLHETALAVGRAKAAGA
jgi:hypothetical protein